MVDTSHSSTPKRLGEEAQNGGIALRKEPSSQVSSGRELREAEMGPRTGVEYLKDIPAATVRQYNQVSPQQQQGWWGHLEERVYSMAKVKALKRKDGKERMRMANQGKLGRGSLLWDASIEACGGAGLFALGKRTSQEKLVPRGAGGCHSTARRGCHRVG